MSSIDSMEQLGFFHLLPDAVSARGALSTQRPADLVDQHFDTVIVGGGILGISMAYHTLRLAAANNKPHRLLLIDRRDLAGEATSLSGGHMGIGFCADHHWLTQAVGQDAADHLYRRSILALHFLRNTAKRFEESYGLTLIQAPAIAQGVLDPSMVSFAEREAAAIDSLIFCDRTMDRIPEVKRTRLHEGRLSLAPLRGLDDFIPREIARGDLPGQYHQGFYNAGEFAVDPAMLRVMLIDLLTETEYGSDVRLCIQEQMNVAEIDVLNGTLHGTGVDGTPIAVRAGRILLAGVDGALLDRTHHLKSPGHIFHSLIGVAAPPSPAIWKDFKAAIHGTDTNYSYMTLWNNGGGPFIFGSGDFSPSQSLSTDAKRTFLNEQAQNVLGTTLSWDSFSLGGNLVYANDNTFHLNQRGAVLQVGGLGGKALSASWMMGKLAAEAALDPQGLSAQFFEQLMVRQSGFDPVALARSTPHYLLPPHLERYSLL